MPHSWIPAEPIGEGSVCSSADDCGYSFRNQIPIVPWLLQSGCMTWYLAIFAVVRQNYNKNSKS